MINKNKKTKISKIILSLVVLCACLFSVLSFRFYSASVEPQKETYPLAETNQLLITSDTNMAFDMKDMYSVSDIIVIGEYIRFDSTWNTARNADDITLEDERFYSEGWIYDFKVDEVLKGDISTNEIKVSHYYSNRFDVEVSNAVVDEVGIIIEPATEIDYYPVTVYNELFIEPEIGAKYMLFLRYNDELDLHFGSIVPSSIKFDNQNIATLQQNEVHDATIIQIENGEAEVVNTMELESYSNSQSNNLNKETVLRDMINGKNIDEIKDEINSY